MIPTQLKSKMAKIIQEKVTPFEDGVLGKLWIKWFRNRHSHLVLRMPQGLDYKRARALSLENVAKFYSNFEKLYLKHNYSPNCI